MADSTRRSPANKRFFVCFEGTRDAHWERPRQRLCLQISRQLPPICTSAAQILPRCTWLTGFAESLRTAALPDLTQGALMSNFMLSRRVVSACVPLLYRIAGGKPLGLVPRNFERSLSTSSLCGREDVRSLESRFWSRANFARSKFASGYTALAPKKLEQIMKIETVIFSPPEEITEIWNDYHIGRGHISAVMGSELYKVFEQRANECPLFVLPLKKGNGFISVVVQAQMPYMLFTALEDYRARGSEASPYFTVTHFTELVPTKGLVLVRGDIVFTSKLSDDEAETLLKTAHSFYINDGRYRKVRKFNKDSREFDFKEVLQELNIPM